MSHDKQGRARPRRKRSKLEQCHPRAAGIDIGARQHWVAVPEDVCDEPVRKFETFTSDLHALADWLVECGITTAAMESTGVYWVPLFEILEARGIKVFLVNGAAVSNVPGRKSDVLDCQWIQQLHSFGLLRSSFLPTPSIAELRAYVRQREMLIRYAGHHVRHMHKALTLMNIQIHTVLSDVTGLSGMKILRALLDGNYDPEALAKHRDPRCKASRERIIESLHGNYRPEHLFALRQAVELYDTFMAKLDACDQQIERTLNSLAANAEPPPQPLPPARRRHAHGKQPRFPIRDPLYRLTGVDITTIGAIAPLTALGVIAEIGTDMSRWPTPKHFTSWLNLAPGTRITGGKPLSSRRRHAPNRAAQLLRMAAVNAGKTDTALGAFYRRIAARRGKGIAVVATARKLGHLIYTLLDRRVPFAEAGAQAYEQRYRERIIRNLRKRATHLGLELVPRQSVGAVS